MQCKNLRVATLQIRIASMTSKPVDRRSGISKQNHSLFWKRQERRTKNRVKGVQTENKRWNGSNKPNLPVIITNQHYPALSRIVQNIFLRYRLMFLIRKKLVKVWKSMINQLDQWHNENPAPNTYSSQVHTEHLTNIEHTSFDKASLTARNQSHTPYSWTKMQLS